MTYSGQLIISSTLFGFESFLTGNLWLRDADEMAKHVASCLMYSKGKDIQKEWGDHPNLVEAVDAEYVIAKLVDSSAPGWDAEAYARSLVTGFGKDELLALALRGDPYTFMGMPHAFELLQVALNGEIKEADPDKIEKHHPDGKRAMEELYAGLRDWVAVHWMPPDMPRIVGEMKRKTVILVN